MNKQMKNLIWIRLKNQFEWSKLGDKDISIKSHALLTMIGYLTALLLVVFYALSLPYQMKLDSQLNDVNLYVTSLLFWVLGIWSLLSGSKNLLVGLDHDQLFVLPIKEWQAKLVTIISSYIIQLILCGIVLFSVQISLYIFHPFPIINLLIAGIFIIVIPLLAISISMLISFFVKWIFVMFHLKNTFIEAILTLFIFISPLLYSYFTVPFNAKYGIIRTSFLPVSLLGDVKESDWLKVILFFLITLVLFTCFVIFIVKKYNQLMILHNVKSATMKTYTLAIQPKIVSLVKKEIHQYFSSFTYVINTVITPIVLFVVAAGVLLGVFPTLPSISIESLHLTISSPIIYFIIFTACLTLTTTTSCSFSFEGKNVWIIQSLPISIKELIIAKSILNILLFIPGLIISIAACWNTFGLRGFDFIIHIVFLLTSLLFVTFLGLALNLKFPNFNWSSEMAVVKQGLSTIVTALVSMIMISFSTLTFILFGTFGIAFVTVIELLSILLILIKMSKIHYLQKNS